ncbi:MAG TPA: hypothetical protein VFC61_00780 [Blastocatellia bacterium]|jgi:hypothetical protein|nr:hypothetical protein [Blastocatellia bacterium]
MPNQVKCLDDPPTILQQSMCLSAVSKNMRGTLKLNVSQEHKCEDPPCKTLKTVHQLKLAPRANQPCDSRLARPFGGTIVVERLVTAFDEDGHHRGFHAGDFVWAGTAGVKVVGRLSGITNAGTHRRPVFDDCQPCDARGVMEGRLCGQVTAADDPALKNCQVMGAYRIKFDPSVTGGSGAVTGVLEGVIICPCRP